MKKSQIKNIAYIIIALVFLLIMFAFAKRFYGETKRISQETECEASIKSHIASHFFGIDFSSNIKCPTQEIEAKTEKDIADALYKCTKRYNQGKNELFGEEAIYCDICYLITPKQEIKNLDNYLRIEKTPEGVTYYDYIMGYKTEEASESIKKQPQLKLEKTITPSKKYAVLFVYAKGSSKIDSLTEMITKDLGDALYIAGGSFFSLTGLALVSYVLLLGSGGPVTLTIGIITGVGGSITAIYKTLTAKEPEWMSMTMLVEYENQKIKEICEILPVQQSLD